MMADFLNTKKVKNQTRSGRAIAEKTYDPIRELPLIETRAEHFLKILRCGKVSTNRSDVARLKAEASDCDVDITQLLRTAQAAFS